METRRVKAIFLFVLPSILYGATLGSMSLMEPDEARYALIPREMIARGDFVTPHLKGVVYLEKPPFVYWVTALFFSLFGEHEFSARLFPALCAWGCTLVTYVMGRRFYGERVGLYGAAVFQTSVLPCAVGRINILDMPLTFLIVSAVWLGFLHFDDRVGKTFMKQYRGGNLYLYGFYLCVALAFLTKGLVGLLFPFVIVGLWLIWMGHIRKIWRLASPLGILIFAAIVLPWLVLVQDKNPDFFRFFFVHEHFLRYTTAIHERTEPFYYYLLVILGGTVPWSAFMPWCLHLGGEVLRETTVEQRRLLILWIVLILVFFSFSSSKLAPYILPVFPPLAVLYGLIIKKGEEGWQLLRFKPSRRFTWWLLPVYIQAFIMAVVVLVPFFIEEYRAMEPPAWPFLLFPFLIQCAIPFVPVIGGRKDPHREWFVVTAIMTAAYWALLIVPVGHYLTPGKSAFQVAAAVASHLPQGERLYQYRITMYGIDFYNRIDTAIVDDPGELGYGMGKMDRDERRIHFPTREEFFRTVAEGRASFVVTEGLPKVEELKKVFPASRVLWDNKKFYMLKLISDEG